MGKWKNEIDEIIRLADNERPQYWRRGQAIFNFAYRMFPEETEKLRMSDVDCFYSDRKIPDFLTALDNLINENR